MIGEGVALVTALAPVVAELVKAFRRWDAGQEDEYGADAQEILVRYAQVEPLAAVAEELKKKARAEGWAESTLNT